MPRRPLSIGEVLTLNKARTKELQDAVASISRDEAKFIFGLYFRQSKVGQRIRHWKRVKKLNTPLPSYISYVNNQIKNQTLKMLDLYTDQFIEGRWAKSFSGVGPAVVAGLILNVDPSKCQYVAQLWRFAGLVPAVLKPISWSKAVAIIHESIEELGESGLPTDRHIEYCAIRAGLKINAVRNRMWSWHGRRAVKEFPAPTWRDLSRAIMAMPYCRPVRRASTFLGAGLAQHKPEPYGRLFLKRFEHERTKPVTEAHAYKMARRWVTKIFLYHYLKVSKFARGERLAKPYSPDPENPAKEFMVPQWPFEEPQPGGA